MAQVNSIREAVLDGLGLYKEEFWWDDDEEEREPNVTIQKIQDLWQDDYYRRIHIHAHVEGVGNVQVEAIECHTVGVWTNAQRIA